jgi:hypothetical protein
VVDFSQQLQASILGNQQGQQASSAIAPSAFQPDGGQAKNDPRIAIASDLVRQIHAFADLLNKGGNTECYANAIDASRKINKCKADLMAQQDEDNEVQAPY